MARRGHRLQPEHCIAHYQNQIGNANPYFSSDFPISPRIWVFSSFRRYALPLMMQVEKYLGKRLLTSDRNIVEDVSQGKSFRHAVRDEIHQSGRKITADVLRKLRGGGGVRRKKINAIQSNEAIETESDRRLFRSIMPEKNMERYYCTKSELELFDPEKIQLAIENSSFVEVHPVASISDSNTIEFHRIGRCLFRSLARLFKHSGKKCESGWNSFHSQRQVLIYKLSFEYNIFGMSHLTQ
ncbi:hypothetical protein AVEN_17020-1 [Araneus ventricosus]|uniref:Uncharacterized protein n=1 Tax=Araneus ventricosus TaxID=182803 RepID=A0A4Y2Q5K9_ARAVE|nr:hypothetical protein AVEN_17020-1 [Araneus ventricosus]